MTFCTQPSLGLFRIITTIHFLSSEQHNTIILEEQYLYKYIYGLHGEIEMQLLGQFLLFLMNLLVG